MTEARNIMVEPRSLSFNNDRWLTDSRIYNLIWMGRWLERAENIARVINTFAGAAVESGSSIEWLQNSLVNAAVIRGIAIDDPAQTLSLLLREHGSSSIYYSITTARNNATQVGPVELIRSISGIVLDLDQAKLPVPTPQEARELSGSVLNGLRRVYEVIEASWFHREAMSEEEVYLRFVQQ